MQYSVANKQRSIIKFNIIFKNIINIDYEYRVFFLECIIRIFFRMYNKYFNFRLHQLFFIQLFFKYNLHFYIKLK